MNRITIILLSLLIFSCAPVSVVMDSYTNGQDKTVAMMKVQRVDGTKDSVIVELLTYHINGQLASKTEMIRNVRHGKHVAYSSSGEIVEQGKYEQNRKSSKWSWFGKEGQPDSVRTYEQGMLSGKSVDYSNSGKKIREMTYFTMELDRKSVV